MSHLTQHVHERLEAVLSIEEDVTLTQASPLLVENLFHLLFNIDVEEDAQRITTTISPPLVSVLLDISLFYSSI